MHKLTAVGIKSLKPRMHNDGGGLYLNVTASGSKSWIFRYKKARKSTDMGLGGYPTVSLAEARRKAAECRRQVASGFDPLEVRKAASKPAHIITFDEAAEQWIEAFKSGWRSPRSAPIRLARLKRYASPVMSGRDVRSIETDDVLRVLSPIWATKSETADSVRQYLDAVFEWCTAKGYRDRNQPNPATWRGNLNHLLQPKSKVHRVTHIPAMPWQDVPAFTVRLREETALSARALELLILTATRTSEVLLAPRSEVSGDLWVIPRERMKSGKEHRVPLTARALAASKICRF